MADARQVGADFVAAFNDHDESRIRELNAENTIFEGPGDVHLEGREAATQYAMAWLNAFPDARLTIKNELVSGDWVVQEFTFEGTHEGTLAGPGGEIPATHRRLNGRGVQVFRVEGDAVADTRL
jgi:predicted ester cyclase